MTPCRPDPKPTTWKSAKYLKFVRNQPCIICGWKAEVHHVRQSRNSGIGNRPNDTWALPLCRLHHSEAHHYGFETFLKNHNIDLYEQLFLLLKLWTEKGAG